MDLTSYITFMVTKESIPATDISTILNMVDIEELEMLIYDFLHPTRKNMIVYNYLITEYNVKIIKHEMYNLFIFRRDMLHGVQNLAMLLQHAARLSNKPVNIVRVIRQDTIRPEEDLEPETTN